MQLKRLAYDLTKRFVAVGAGGGRAYMRHRGSDGRQAPRLEKPYSGGICCRTNSKSLAMHYAVWPFFLLSDGNRVCKRRVCRHVPATSRLAYSQRNRLANTR